MKSKTFEGINRIIGKLEKTLVKFVAEVERTGAEVTKELRPKAQSALRKASDVLRTAADALEEKK